MENSRTIEFTPVEFTKYVDTTDVDFDGIYILDKEGSKIGYMDDGLFHLKEQQGKNRFDWAQKNKITISAEMNRLDYVKAVIFYKKSQFERTAWDEACMIVLEEDNSDKGVESLKDFVKNTINNANSILTIDKIVNHTTRRVGEFNPTTDSFRIEAEVEPDRAELYIKDIDGKLKKDTRVLITNKK